MPGLDLRGNQPNMVYTRGMADVYNFRNVAKIELVVALDEHHVFGARREDVVSLVSKSPLETSSSLIL